MGHSPDTLSASYLDALKMHFTRSHVPCSQKTKAPALLYQKLIFLLEAAWSHVAIAKVFLYRRQKLPSRVRCQGIGTFVQ